MLSGIKKITHTQIGPSKIIYKLAIHLHIIFFSRNFEFYARGLVIVDI